MDFSFVEDKNSVRPPSTREQAPSVGPQSHVALQGPGSSSFAGPGLGSGLPFLLPSYHQGHPGVTPPQPLGAPYRPPPPRPSAKPAGASSLPASGNAIIYNKVQKGNPVLKFIRHVSLCMGGDDMVPDYQLGLNNAALYLSLRYHLLHPEYIIGRMKEMRGHRTYLLVLVDVEDMVKPLGEVTKAAVVHECTLLCAWSVEEAARYLETLKSYETKSAGVIQERVEHDYMSRLTAALTCVRGVNKTDVFTLGTHQRTLAKIFQSEMKELSACPGLGPTKVQRLYETFKEPFRRTLRPGDRQGGQGVSTMTHTTIMERTLEEDEEDIEEL